MKKINCSICGKKHVGIETTICESCSEKYVEALTKIMSKKDADNLIWVIGNVDQGMRWNSDEVVKQQDRLDILDNNFKEHDHKNGKVVTYL